MNKKNQPALEKSEQNKWFSVWFNTTFYHLLYNKRNYEEAEAFISQLLRYLNPATGSKALDLACGAGRHSITLNKSGLDVLGVDLSTNSIAEAKKHENSSLHFEVHDMRHVVYPLQFDYIFNLFTSFGYFDSPLDDEKVLQACHQQLKPDGLLILDYFNIEKIAPTLPYQGVEKRDEIEFVISKKIIEKYIIKTIDFTADEKDFHFEERVAAYTIKDFEAMLSLCGFRMVDVFGNYSLEQLTQQSDRVIIIAQKN